MSTACRRSWKACPGERGSSAQLSIRSACRSPCRPSAMSAPRAVTAAANQPDPNSSTACYAYIVAADTPSAYVPGNQFVLMRVPVAHILDLTFYEFFSGTPAAPAWVGFANRASRTPIFKSNNLCMRTGMSYDAARGRFYWWQQIPLPNGDIYP